MFQNYQQNCCGDFSPFNANGKFTLASPKPSYVSKFASKVRQDAKKNRQHWSSMGLPSSVSDPHLSRPAARNLSPIRPSDLESHRSLGSLRLNNGPMNTLPLNSLVPRSKWQSYYQMKPALVRSKDKTDDKFILPPIEQKTPRHKDPDFDIVEYDSNEEERSLALPEILPNRAQNDLLPTKRSTAHARRLMDSNKMKDLISPMFAKQLQGDYTNKALMLHDYNADAHNAQLEGLASDKSTCDALILQKLLEIQAELQKGHNKCSCCGKQEENDKKMDDCKEKEPLIQHCYTGDVDIIDQGPKKDFLLDNALNCSRMPPKFSPDIVMDDWKGHKAKLSPRMVFKKDFGRVPEYIKRRKEEQLERQDELQRVAIEEADRKCRAITDYERQTIIDGLGQHWEQLFDEFQKLPLVSTAPRVLKKKGQLEAQLRDLESDLRLISSHGRLFVSNEGPTTQFLWK